MKVKYKRILLKMSGEVFKGKLQSGIDYSVVTDFAKRIKKIHDTGIEIGIVIGGGNIWRYRDNVKKDKDGYELDRVTSDTLGMIATNMNALAFEAVLDALKVPVKALTTFSCGAIEAYSIRKGLEYLKKGCVVIFGGGTGKPYFTTDSGAAMRATEMKCDVLMKATKVDYVYDRDPMKYKTAKKFEKLTYDQVLDQELDVMDMTCASICKKGKLPMLVFNLNKKGLLEKAVRGDKVGTIILP
jgi:uridylate kinase